MTARAEWLASLKVGDEVGVSHRYQGKHTRKIETITPSRRISVASASGRGILTFDASGNQYPRVRGYDEKWAIHPVDDVFLSDIARQRMDSDLRGLLRDLDIHRHAPAPAGFDYATHNAALRACLEALGRKP